MIQETLSERREAPARAKNRADLAGLLLPWAVLLLLFAIIGIDRFHAPNQDAGLASCCLGVMAGIPTWMYQLGVAAVLILSFGLFDLFSRKSGRRFDGFLQARLDLTGLKGVRALIKWPPLVAILRGVVSAVFILVILAGLFGDQNPAMNIAPLLTWTVWWAGLIFLILFAGKLWCTVCPWDAIATWTERLKFWGPRKGGLGLQLSWPRSLRNIWPAVGLFLLLTWVELGAGITMIPRATAWVALAILGMTVVSALLFERKAFCRYACLIGRVSGLYAMFSSVEVRAADPDACASCKSLACCRGSDKGDGCPTFEVPRTMSTNTYCTLCTECFKTCTRDNMALRLRPWGTDLAGVVRPRTDEATLALILLSMTGFHGLTMTPAWTAANESLRAAWGLAYWASFSLLMTAMLAAPVLIYSGLLVISARLAAVSSSRPDAGGAAGYKTLFLSYAYALLPIALFYHLAHNAEHFMMEGPKLIALASDPFGWGWNLFGTADMTPGPLVSMAALWNIQLLFILIGHIYSLWITDTTTRRLIPAGRRAFLTQVPMLVAMVAFSVFSLWLLKQPMMMRVTGM